MLDFLFLLALMAVAGGLLWRHYTEEKGR